jgi:hypothetical protein
MLTLTPFESMMLIDPGDSFDSILFWLCVPTFPPAIWVLLIVPLLSMMVKLIA